MNLDGSYEFSDLTQIEGIFVSNGREKASGKIIQIHLFPAGKSEQANRICQQLFSLPDEARDKILKYGQEGSASYFVTDPLPDGEYLQSWIERLSTRRQSPSVPEVGPGITSQLRQLGIVPSPLAPMMPGPEGSQKGPRQGLDAAGASHVPSPGGSPVQPGEMTREFRSLYGNRQEEPVFARSDFHDEPTSEPLTASAAPGLETFLGLRPGSPTAEPKASAPPLGSPVPSPEEPVRSQPVVSFDAAPPDFPIRDTSQGPSWVGRPRLQTEPTRNSTVAPVRTKPVPMEKKPRSSPGNLDWKTIVMIAAAFLILAALVIAIVETSG